MNRNHLKLLFFALTSAFVSITCHADEKPNLVLIFIDDMGYGDIGPFGSTLNRTPHLDRMAAEGMKLTSFYAAPVCSASRAQLLTGCYAPRVSVPGVFFPAGAKGLNPDEQTVAEYLRAGVRDHVRRQVAPGRSNRFSPDQSRIRSLLRHSLLERHAAQFAGRRTTRGTTRSR